MGSEILPTLKLGHRWKRYLTVSKLMTSADDGCPSTVVKRGKMCVYERERGGEVEVIGQSRTEF